MTEKTATQFEQWQLVKTNLTVSGYGGHVPSGSIGIVLALTDRMCNVRFEDDWYKEHSGYCTGQYWLLYDNELEPVEPGTPFDTASLKDYYAKAEGLMWCDKCWCTHKKRELHPWQCGRCGDDYTGRADDQDRICARCKARLLGWESPSA